MGFNGKDVVATGLVATVVVAYAGHLAGNVPFVENVRGMAIVGLILGFGSRRIGGRGAFRHPRVAFAAGLASIALGIVTIATESAVLLAVFVASILALWTAAAYVRFDSIGVSH